MPNQNAPRPGIDQEQAGIDQEQGQSSSEPLQITLTVEQDGTYDVDGDSYPTIREALLAIVKKVRDNPVGDNGQQQMDAGYRAEGGPVSGEDAGESEGNRAQGQ